MNYENRGNRFYLFNEFVFGELRLEALPSLDVFVQVLKMLEKKRKRVLNS